MASDFDPYYKWLGIRPDERPVTHYRLLGIAPFEADCEVIANAADQRMALLKTFQAGRHSAESQRLLNEIAKARVCLLNRDKKTVYDQGLRRLAASNSVRSSTAQSEQGVVADSLAAQFLQRDLALPRVRPITVPSRSRRQPPWLGWLAFGLSVVVAAILMAVLAARERAQNALDVAAANQIQSAVATVRPRVAPTPEAESPPAVPPTVPPPTVPPPTVPPAAPHVPSVPPAPTSEPPPAAPAPQPKPELFEVPTFVELPKRTDLTPVQVAVISPSVESVRLRTPQGSSAQFEALPDGNVWRISMGRTTVATLTHNDPALSFAWEKNAPAAAEPLRNAVLTLGRSNYDRSLALRGPIEHGDLTIDLSKTSMSVPLNLQLWELDIKSLIVELADVTDSQPVVAYLPADRRLRFGTEARLLFRKDTPTAAIDVALSRTAGKHFLKLWPRMIDHKGATFAWSQSSFKKLVRGIQHDIDDAASFVAAEPAASRAIQDEIALIRRQTNSLNRSLAAVEIERLNSELAELRSRLAVCKEALPVWREQLRQIEPLGHLGNQVHQKAKLKFRVFYMVDQHEVDILRNL